MTLQAIAATVNALPAEGGLAFPVNCPGCGGGFLLEASSRGRDDVAFPCREIRSSLYCAHCKDRYVLEVRIGIATRERTPERRYTRR